MDFDDPTHFIIFSDTKGIFENPERFFVGRSGAAKCFFYIGSYFWLQLRINLLLSFHAINDELEYWKLFCRTVAPYANPFYFNGALYRIKFDCELIGIIKINVQGVIFRSYDSVDDYVREYEDLQKSIVCPQKYTKMIAKHFICLE